MMLNKGTVIKIQQNKALVLSPDSGFILIKRTPLMEVGRMAFYDSSDIIKTTKTPKINILGKIAAVLALILMVSYIYTQFTGKVDDYACLDIDVNPSIRLTINRDLKVTGLKPLNEDAQPVTKDMNLKMISVEQAFTEIMEKISRMGIISNKNRDTVIVSMAINDDILSYKNENSAYKSQIEAIAGKIRLTRKVPQIKEIRYIMASPEEKAKSDDLKVSMGRYVVMEKALEKGNTLDKTKLKNNSIMSLIKENAIDLGDREIKVSGTNTPITQTSEKSRASQTPRPLTVELTKIPMIPVTHGPTPHNSPVKAFPRNTPEPLPAVTATVLSVKAPENSRALVKTNVPIKTPEPENTKKPITAAAPLTFNTNAPSTALNGYPEWKILVEYKKGDIVSYKGALYICIQSHKSSSMWDPPYVPALWIKKKQ